MYNWTSLGTNGKKMHFIVLWTVDLLKKTLNLVLVKMVLMFESGTQNYRSMGESTLQWPLLGCHIRLFFKGVHVWIYLTPNFWKNFITFLHIMLEYTLGKILKKRIISFHFIKGKIGIYLWKQMQCTYVFKNTNIPQK